jgi:hypothetical protein
MKRQTFYPQFPMDERSYAGIHAYTIGLTDVVHLVHVLQVMHSMEYYIVGSKLLDSTKIETL